MTLRLTLHVPPGPARLGEPAPVSVLLTNDGGRPVPVVGVLDGSETGRRYPHYLPQVLHEGAEVAAPGHDEDPLTGPLRPQDVVQVAAGETVDPTSRDGGRGWLPLSTFANFRPAEAGVYRFVLVLDTRAPDPQAWLGRFGQEPIRDQALRRVARVPRVRLTAAVDVRVE